MKNRFLAKLFRKDTRGVASIEFAFIASALGVTMLNVADVAIFLYDKLETENATQMGAQAAYAACPVNQLPATVNCPGLNTAINAAVQSTSLGTAAAVVTGYPTEAYYCVGSSGALTNVGAASSVSSTGTATAVPPPADCSAAGSSSTKPGDYLQVQVTYNFTPLFNGSLTVASLLPATITDTAWVRLF